MSYLFLWQWRLEASGLGVWRNRVRSVPTCPDPRCGSRRRRQPWNTRPCAQSGGPGPRFKVRSLNQFHFAAFLQSRVIIVEEWYLYLTLFCWQPCIKTFSESAALPKKQFNSNLRGEVEGPFGGAVSAQKTFQGSMTMTMELLQWMTENKIVFTDDYFIVNRDLPCRQNRWFFKLSKDVRMC